MRLNLETFELERAPSVCNLCGKHPFTHATRCSYIQVDEETGEILRCKKRNDHVGPHEPRAKRVNRGR